MGVLVLAGGCGSDTDGEAWAPVADEGTDGDGDGHGGHDTGGDAGATDDGAADDRGDAADDRGDDGDSGDSGGPPMEPPGAPNCYSEPLFVDADVSDIVAAYGGPDWKQDLIDAMDARWPAGAYLLSEQQNDAYFSQFSDPNSWSGMVSWLDTLVHEQTHLFNAYHAIDVGENASLYFREDLIMYLPPEQGFARAEILPELAPGPAAGIYTGTYLTGEQGTRGFNAVLDEYSCYLNEVPGMAVFGDDYPGLGVSLRDGAAAFSYFLQAYLKVAREQHPDFYDWAKGQPVYVDAVHTLWVRTQFMFEEVGDLHPSLGIDDAMYRDAALEPDNLMELELFTGKRYDASPCWE